jgi:hypothetical protein
MKHDVRVCVYKTERALRRKPSSYSSRNMTNSPDTNREREETTRLVLQLKETVWLKK